LHGSLLRDIQTGQHIHHPIKRIFNGVQGVGGHLGGTVYSQLWFVPWRGFEGLMGVYAQRLYVANF
jgi:hypothetical protein